MKTFDKKQKRLLRTSVLSLLVKLALYGKHAFRAREIHCIIYINTRILASSFSESMQLRHEFLQQKTITKASVLV